MKNFLLKAFMLIMLMCVSVGAWAGEETYNFSSFTSAQDVELNATNFTITLHKRSGSSNPAWSSNQARVYAKGSLEVSSQKTITKIVYTYVINASSKGKVPTIDGVEGSTSAGSWDEETKTWTGSDTDVTLSTSGDAGNVGFTSVTVTYENGSKETTTLSWSAATATVTIDADDNVFPTLSTTPVNLSGVTYSSSNAEAATINATTGAITLVGAGATTITASFAGDATHYAATSASYDLTVKAAPVVDGYTHDVLTCEDLAATSTTYTAFSNVSKNTAVYAGNSSKNNGIQLRTTNSNSGIVTTTSGGNIKKIIVAWNSNCASGRTLDVYGKNTAYNAASDLYSSENATKGTKLGSIVMGTSTELTVTGDYEYVGVRSNSGALIMDAIEFVWEEITSTSLTISAAGYATFFDSTHAIELPSGMTGYVWSDGLQEMYNAGDVVPAGEPIVVKAAAGDYTLNYTTTSEETYKDNEMNDLDGTDAETELTPDDSYYFYGLSLNAANELSSVGFYWMAAGGAAFTNGAHKAYLKLANTAGARSGYAFNEDTEALESIEMSAATTIYTLNGVKVNELQKGLNIVNGKKVMVK